LSRKLWRFVKTLYVRTFEEDSCSSLAAAISFYAIVSFLPFVILAVSIASYFVASSAAATEQIQDFITNVMPGVTARAFDMMSGTLAQKTVFGVLGLVGLLWASMRIFAVLEASMNRIWRAPKHRSFWESRLVSLISIPLMAVFLLLSIGLTGVISVAKSTEIPGLGVSLADLPGAAATVTYLLPILISTLLFLSIYYLLPKRWDHFKSALWGALLAAVLWEVAKLLFDIYIRNFSHMRTIYGSFTSLAVLFLWVYYSAMVVLIGAEFGSLLKSKKASAG
jgi:membrane protein